MQSLKHTVKRAFTLNLAIIILTTSLGLNNLIPTTEVHAGTTGGNTGGTSSSLGSTSKYMGWSATRSGYRFYIINNKMERISNVLDIVHEKPTQVKTWVKSTRYDTENSPKEWTYYVKTDQVIKNLWGDELIKGLCYPISLSDDTNGISVGQGDKFQSWFLLNIKTTTSKGGVQRPVIKTNKTYNKNQNSSSSSSSTDIELRNYSSYISNGKKVESEAALNVKSNPGTMAYYMANLENYYIMWRVAGKTIYNYALMQYEVYWTQNKAFNGSTQNGKYYALGALYDYLSSVPYGYRANLALVIETYANSNSLAKNTTEDILSTNIPLATTSEEVCPCTQLLRHKNLLRVPGFDSAMDAIISNDYYLIVEPVTWLHVSTAPKQYPGVNERTYGTYSNIYDLWKGTDNAGDFYGTILTRLGACCMLVEEEFKTTDGKVISQVGMGDRNISVLRAMVNQENPYSGVSMHLYHSGDFKIADTSTCDESLDGEEGPAPDDSDKLIKDKDGNLVDPDFEDGKYPEVANIVKFYELYEDDKLVYNDSFTRTPTPKEIRIEDEGFYEIEDWYTSVEYKEATGSEPRYDKYKKDMDVVHDGKSTGIVTLYEETTLYVKLVAKTKSSVPSVKGDWTLSESRLTKIASTNTKTDTQDKVGNVIGDKGITINLDAIESTHENCYKQYYDNCKKHGTYTQCNREGCERKGKSYKSTVCTEDCVKYFTYPYISCKGHTKSSTMDYTDNQLSVKVIAGGIEKNLRTSTSVIGQSDSYTRGSKDAHNYTFKGYTETFLIHRAGYDTPQQYTGVIRTGTSSAGSNISAMSSIGFTAANTTPVFRQADAFTKTLNLNYILDASACDFITSTACTYSGNTSKKEQIEEHPHTSTDTVAEGQYTTSFSTSGTVAINTYPGKLTGGVMDFTYDQNATMSPSVDGFGVASGTMVQQPTKQFRFYPFIQMQYDTLSSNGSKSQNQKINITGIWQRGMQVNDYAEVAWNSNTKENNLHVTSNQWSTHAKALELAKSLGSTLKNVILPGGAIYSLDTKGSNQTVQVATYQTILIDEGLAQAEYTSKVSDDLKHNTAINEHKDFVGQVKSNLESLNLEQYVSTKATDKNAWQNGKKVYNGSDISYLKNGSSTASEDDKYYLKNDKYGLSGLANEADLDVKELSTSYSYYTFYSTVEGDIYMVKAENVAQGQYPTGKGTKILSKKEDASKLSSSGDENIAKKINTRTLVVDKLVKSVERNTGNDKSASWASSDGHWYNEAFNGVTVVVQKTQLSVGLKNPTVRTTILDPRLIPQQSSKGTIFTKAFLSQYKTSNTPMGTGKPNVIGTFKGRDITLANLDLLFYSNKFYIPDATVQDLS